MSAPIVALHEFYRDNEQEFQNDFCECEGRLNQFGFDSSEEMWDANPTVIVQFNGQERNIMYQVGVAPFVGQVCTYGIGTDCYADTVTKVSKSMRQIETAGHGKFSLRDDGRYRPVGCKYSSLTLGFAKDYRDPSF